MATVRFYRGHWVADYYDTNKRRRIERISGLGRCSWVLVGDAGLGTEMETTDLRLTGWKNQTLTLDADTKPLGRCDADLSEQGAWESCTR